MNHAAGRDGEGTLIPSIRASAAYRSSRPTRKVKGRLRRPLGLCSLDPPAPVWRTAIRRPRQCCLFDTTGNTLRPFGRSRTCPALRAKILSFPKDRTYEITKATRPHEGRNAIVTIRGAGRDGRVGPQDVRRYRVRSSRVVLSPRRWGQVAQTIAQRRRLTSPVLRGERGAAVKPLRRECWSDFGVPVLTCVRLFCFARKAVGAACTRHSLRPLLEGATFDALPGRRSCRGNAIARPTAAVPSRTRDGSKSSSRRLRARSPR